MERDTHHPDSLSLKNVATNESGNLVLEEPPVCSGCGKKAGDKDESGEVVRVRMFNEKLMCSECEDGLCYCWEN